MDFYDEVLRELLVALGAALFLGNVLALLRRRALPPGEAGERGADGEAVMTRPPVARTATYALMGLIIMVWGIASMAAS